MSALRTAAKRVRDLSDKMHQIDPEGAVLLILISLALELSAPAKAPHLTADEKSATE